MITTIKMKAKNDTNGNPRKLYAVYKNSTLIKTYDIGYQGSHVLPLEYRNNISSDTIYILPTEYKRLLKEYN